MKKIIRIIRATLSMVLLILVFIETGIATTSCFVIFFVKLEIDDYVRNKK